MNNIITIDANIGAGKSSLLKHIHKKYDILINPEPVEDWQPFLKKIYEENTGYAQMQFQVWKRSLIQVKTDSLMLMERSPLMVNETFLEIHHDIKNINDEDYSELKRMYEYTLKLWKPIKYVYLRVSPAICLEHIQMRDRESENMISIDYLETIHEYHERAIKKLRNTGMDVCIINGDNKDIDEITQELLSLIGYEPKRKVILKENDDNNNGKS